MTKNLVQLSIIWAKIPNYQWVIFVLVQYLRDKWVINYQFNVFRSNIIKANLIC